MITIGCVVGIIQFVVYNKVPPVPWPKYTWIVQGKGTLPDALKLTNCKYPVIIGVNDCQLFKVNWIWMPIGRKEVKDF